MRDRGEDSCEKCSPSTCYTVAGVARIAPHAVLAGGEVSTVCRGGGGKPGVRALVVVHALPLVALPHTLQPGLTVSIRGTT